VLQKSTLQLLRFPFSIFLMPIYFLALGECEQINSLNANLIFIILHVFIYPASNGYNSYMDRDTGSIGIIEKPLPATKQLFYVTIFMDLIGLLLALFVNINFFLLLLLYIAASRAYSYRGIRLKKYPIIGFLTVIIFQGGNVLYMVILGSSNISISEIPILLPLVACALIGSFYPLTQIYQHQQDKQDGVTTISYLLGYKGTFIFTIILNAVANILLFSYYALQLTPSYFFIFQLFLLPVMGYFIFWMVKVFKNQNEANFLHSFKMSAIASIFTNLAFATIFILNYFG
jgi:1,4-dihydroxy-2-naphthoate polyprenyltransferase